MEGTSKKTSKCKCKSSLPEKHLHRIKNRTRSTPWYSPSEFDYVGRCLSRASSLFANSSDKENLEKNICPLDDDAYNELVYGIDQVSRWRKRAENSRLPIHIDASACLADVLLQDATHQLQKMTQEEYIAAAPMSLRLSYASLIIRAVNGIADAMQKNRAINGSSVSHLCSKANLPMWIVDLRHDSSHNELPSLSALRLGAKVLLNFLMDKYWSLLEQQRVVWSEHASSLLMECKKALKTLDRHNTTQKSETEDDDDDDDYPADEEGLSREEEKEEDANGGDIYGAYSIFANNAKKENDEIRKKKSNHQRKTSRNTSRNSSRLSSLEGRTPRQCLNELSKTIPMDIGVNIVTSYLVHGGTGDAPDQRGILIPGSQLTFPETIESARKIRERYSLIIIVFASKWPGFVHALFVNLIEFILDLENIDILSTDANLRQAQDEGRQRKLYFLIQWVFYLLSNEFYYFLTWHDLTFNGSRNMRQRPKEKWSQDLYDLMEKNAPLSVLKKAQLPLNSICDRCILEGRGDTSKHIVTKVRSILGNDRVRGLFVDHKKEGNKRPREASVASSANDEKRVKRSEDEGEGEEILSLEHFENMLSGDGEEEAIINGDDEVENDEADAMKEIPAGDIIKPWSMCTSWDACEIGTIPGYTS
mmetsp:Transcript_470/g.782  ORF Transcript_470/g.782 Transcript_470/m.782 type:complete len:648 (+) Transcript_470:165-2108(+)